jgi:two-component system sensor histidine kinase DegS
MDNSQAALVIKDNGTGFDPAKINESGGLGLKLIKERAEMLGGSLKINADVENGVEIALSFPITEAAA